MKRTQFRTFSLENNSRGYGSKSRVDLRGVSFDRRGDLNGPGFSELDAKSQLRKSDQKRRLRKWIKHATTKKRIPKQFDPGGRFTRFPRRRQTWRAAAAAKRRAVRGRATRATYSYSIAQLSKLKISKLDQVQLDQISIITETKSNLKISTLVNRLKRRQP